MFCYKCGYRAHTNDNFCMRCGARLNTNDYSSIRLQELNLELEQLRREYKELERQQIEMERLEEIQRQQKKEAEKLERIRRQREEEEKMSAYIVVKQRYLGILYDLSGPYESYEDAAEEFELYQSIWKDILLEDQYIEIEYK